MSSLELSQSAQSFIRVFLGKVRIGCGPTRIYYFGEKKDIAKKSVKDWLVPSQFQWTLLFPLYFSFAEYFFLVVSISLHPHLLPLGLRGWVRMHSFGHHTFLMSTLRLANVRQACFFSRMPLSQNLLKVRQVKHVVGAMTKIRLFLFTRWNCFVSLKQNRLLGALFVIAEVLFRPSLFSTIARSPAYNV